MIKVVSGRPVFCNVTALNLLILTPTYVANETVIIQLDPLSAVLCGGLKVVVGDPGLVSFP